MLRQIMSNANRCTFKGSLLLLLALFVWLILYQDTLVSVVRIWYISEIFSHGFFIVPGALYLIWRERDKLKQQPLKPNFWVVPLLLIFLLLGVFGQVGGIQVFSHISAFVVLPLAIWFCVGNAMAKIIWFPLCFMLFSIPIGEQLVPFLQKITADLAIGILNWTSIPVFSTGLYIEIPQGKFVVAEACSGIRFFVGSLVFGAVYSHLSYQSFARKSLFMLLALVVPVLANAVRVFGIVVIGYFSDMEYASGADHIIYGWVFFSIVLFLLVLVGESLREKNSALVPNEADEKPEPFTFPRSAGLTLCSILLLTLIWQKNVTSEGEVVKSVMVSAVLEAFERSEQESLKSSWSPIFQGESDLFRGHVLQNSDKELSELPDLNTVDVILAWYAENRNATELVSSLNALYDKLRWSKVRSESVDVHLNGKLESARLLSIVSISDEQRFVLYWYQLPDKVLSHSIITKLFQSLDVLIGGKGAGALVMLSSSYEERNAQTVRDNLIRLAEQKSSALLQAVPF